jgi:nucleotide-binding universal stress UspA family protein
VFLTASCLPADTSAPALPRIPPRVLAVVLDRDDVEITLPAAIAVATEERRELCVAVIRPWPADPQDAALDALLGEPGEREAEELLQRAHAVTAAAGILPTVSVHLLAGLRSPDDRQVLDRVVARLARHYDAQPVGGWTA